MKLHASLISLFAALAVSQAQTPVKWACIGNSITYGVGSSGATGNPAVYPNSYPARLAAKLGSGFTVENDGVNSTQILKSGNVPYWTQGKLANVFAFKPNIITVKLGTNDSKPRNWQDSVNFVRDLTAFVDTLAGISSHPQIWLCLPVPTWQEVTYPLNLSDATTHSANIIKYSIIPRILQVAAAKGLRVIDLNTPLANHRQLFPDNVHPNNAGADSIASIIYRAYIASTGIYHIQQPLIFQNSPGFFGSLRFYSLDGKNKSKNPRERMPREISILQIR